MNDDFSKEIARTLAPGGDIAPPSRDEVWGAVAAARVRSTRARFRRRATGAVVALIAAGVVVFLVSEHAPGGRNPGSVAQRGGLKVSPEIPDGQMARLTESERISIHVIDSALANTKVSPVASDARAAQERIYLLTLRERVLARAAADDGGPE